MHWLDMFIEEILQWVLLIVYIATLLSQIVLCIKSLVKKNNKLWRADLIFELVMGIVAFALAYYFDNFATGGGGFFPGLTYIGIILFSLFAAIGYAGLLVLTLVIGGIVFFVLKKKNSRE